MGRKEECVPGKGHDLGEGTKVVYNEQQEEEGRRGARWLAHGKGTYKHQSPGLFGRVTQLKVSLNTKIPVQEEKPCLLNVK